MTLGPNLLADTMNVNVGTVVRFGCIHGFSLLGDPVTFCQNDGTWNTSVPTCVIQCPQIPSQEHTSASSSNRSVNAEVILTCDDGYKIEGQTKIHCMKNGSWSAPFPICVAIISIAVSQQICASIQHTVIPVLQYTGAPVPQHTSAPVPQHTSARVPQHTGHLVPQYTAGPVPQYTCVLVTPQHTSTAIQQSTSIQAQAPTSTPPIEHGSNPMLHHHSISTLQHTSFPVLKHSNTSALRHSVPPHISSLPGPQQDHKG